MPWSAFLMGNVQAVVRRVTQMGHGFEVGYVVVFDGTNYILSLSDSEIDCGGSLMVSQVIDADTIELTIDGYVTGITTQAVDPNAAFNPGDTYYISPTQPGRLTVTKPTTVGFVNFPCFLSDSATSGYFWGGYGQLITGSSLPTVVATTNTVMVPNTIYRCNAVAQLDMTLPAVMAVDDVIRIETMNTGGFILKQNLGQSTHLTGAGLTTTPGAGGSIQLNAVSGSKSGNLNIKCVTANTTFRTFDGSGDYTVV